MKTQIEIKDGVFTVKGNNAELLRAIVALTDEQGGAQVTDYDGPKVESEDASPKLSVYGLRDSLGAITVDGKVVSYREAIEAFSGNYFIHRYPGVEEVLETAVDPEFDWAEVVDFLCPVADEILINAKEVNETAYIELVSILKKTYEMLKATYEEEERKEVKRGEVPADGLSNVIPLVHKREMLEPHQREVYDAIMQASGIRPDVDPEMCEEIRRKAMQYAQATDEERFELYKQELDFRYSV
ncbi:hypothetical protein [Paenibacillus dendritiformis]|uniref:hypothetical protein n=1 Tax=Paenibacillus dendritiformis TaxID=130049 RepID=UPI00387E11AB